MTNIDISDVVDSPLKPQKVNIGTDYTHKGKVV
jgi:hypothetical protein